MIIWVLLMMSQLNSPTVNVYVNTFDSKAKCEAFLKRMEPLPVMKCVKTEVNK